MVVLKKKSIKVGDDYTLEYINILIGLLFKSFTNSPDDVEEILMLIRPKS